MSTDSLVRQNFTSRPNRLFLAVRKESGEILGTIALFHVDDSTAKLRRCNSNCFQILFAKCGNFFKGFAYANPPAGWVLGGGCARVSSMLPGRRDTKSENIWEISSTIIKNYYYSFQDACGHHFEQSGWPEGIPGSRIRISGQNRRVRQQQFPHKDVEVFLLSFSMLWFGGLFNATKVHGITNVYLQADL